MKVLNACVPVALFLAASTAMGDYADVILADGLVAYWQLDETDAGDEVTDRVGNVDPGNFFDDGGLKVGEPGAEVVVSRINLRDEKSIPLRHC